METTEKKIPVLEKNTLPAIKKFVLAIADYCGATKMVGKTKGGHDSTGAQYATLSFRLDGHENVEFSVLSYDDKHISVTRSVQDGNGFFSFTMFDSHYQRNFGSTEEATKWIKETCEPDKEDEHFTKIGRQA